MLVLMFCHMRSEILWILDEGYQHIPKCLEYVLYDWCCREQKLRFRKVAGDAFLISAGSAIIDGKM